MADVMNSVTISLLHVSNGGTNQISYQATFLTPNSFFLGGYYSPYSLYNVGFVTFLEIGATCIPYPFNGAGNQGLTIVGGAAGTVNGNTIIVSTYMPVV
jgi:hypothetical protein